MAPCFFVVEGGNRIGKANFSDWFVMILACPETFGLIMITGCCQRQSMCMKESARDGNGCMPGNNALSS
jgi:hypothetical protein